MPWKHYTGPEKEAPAVPDNAFGLEDRRFEGLEKIAEVAEDGTVTEKVNPDRAWIERRFFVQQGGGGG